MGKELSRRLQRCGFQRCKRVLMLWDELKKGQRDKRLGSGDKELDRCVCVHARMCACVCWARLRI